MNSENLLKNNNKNKKKNVQLKWLKNDKRRHFKMLQRKYLAGKEGEVKTCGLEQGRREVRTGDW